MQTVVDCQVLCRQTLRISSVHITGIKVNICISSFPMKEGAGFVCVLHVPASVLQHVRLDVSNPTKTYSQSAVTEGNHWKSKPAPN